MRCAAGAACTPTYSCLPPAALRGMARISRRVFFFFFAETEPPNRERFLECRTRTGVVGRRARGRRCAPAVFWSEIGVVQLALGPQIDVCARARAVSEARATKCA